MMQHLLIVVALATGACKSTDQKCHDIRLQQLYYEANQEAEAAFEKSVLQYMGRTGRSAAEYPAVKRELRAKEAAARRERNRRQYPNDTFMWKLPDPALDSTDPVPQAPPRPSEIRWYNEHCWEGKAR